MKKALIILVLFLFPILISFNSYGGSSDKTVCVETDGQNRGGIIFLPNQTEPFTGNNLCEYKNGQFKSKGKVKDGIPDGKWTFWHQNGQIEEERNFKDGNEVSRTEYYYNENGQIEEERNFKDGNIYEEVSRTEYYYNEYGQIWSKTTYEDGNEVSTSYIYKNGQIFFKLETTYEDGNEVSGASYQYYENGQMEREMNYKDREPDGKDIWWYENGQIKEERNFKDGIENGKVTFWHQNGQIEAEGTFKEGKLDGNVTEWFENGQIKAEATFKDDKCISGDCSNFK